MSDELPDILKTLFHSLEKPCGHVCNGCKRANTSNGEYVCGNVLCKMYGKKVTGHNALRCKQKEMK